MLLKGHWLRVFISMVAEYLSCMTGIETVATLFQLESSCLSVVYQQFGFSDFTYTTCY
jgi:hypothetical protein